MKGEGWKGYYCADGSGVVKYEGQSLPREWKLDGDDKICITRPNGDTDCFTYVQHKKKPNKYKATRIKDRKVYRFTLKDEKPDMCS